MSRISIPQLEAFYWVAELGSVHKAAAKLNVTQPTLSLRLQQLQQQTPSPVLEPYGRGVRLTRAGRGFLKRAALVLEAYSALHAPSSSRAITGVLRIGLAEGFAVACLPHLVLALTQAHTLLRPEWTVATSAGLEQGVVDGQLDLAVIVDPIGDARLGLVPLGLQANVWAGPPGLAARARLSAGALASCTIITTPPPTAMYRNTIAWFAALGRAPGPLCICTSVNAAAQLAAAGIGCGIFPSRMIEAQRAIGAVEAIPVDPPLPSGRLYVAARTDADLDRTEAVTSILEQVTRQLDYFGVAG